MKIGILTQRLFTNYGGLLQSYALQTVLERMGHEVLIFDREYNDKEKFSPWTRFISLSKRLLYNITLVLRGKSVIKDINDEQTAIVRKYTNPFITKYIHSTSKIYTSAELKESVFNWLPDAMIVGSDQVWRPVYSPMISNYFLDFTEDWSIKRLSYAASFGVDEWEYNMEDTVTCTRLAQKFDAISVREDSGIELCRKFLGVDAIQTLDPTLLLDKQDYIDIINNENEPKSAGNLFCYVLDTNQEKRQLIKDVASKLCMTDYYCMPSLPLSYSNIKKNIEACVAPRPSQWLRCFLDAKLVITDSFHGVAFSIIFNKPFWILINKERGAARFTSILKVFNLESRMISTEEASYVDWNANIDWNAVNAKRNISRKQSLEFLTSNLR